MVDIKTKAIPQFYDHLWSGLVGGFIILDEEGIVIAANEMAAAMMGYEPDELVGSAYPSFWPEDFPFPDAGDTESRQSHQVQLRQRDGELMPVSLTIFPLDAAGVGHRLVAISGSDQVDRFNNALSHTQRLAGVGILTAGVAHELITPISIITNTCSNLRTEIEANNLQSEGLLRYIQMIEQSIWRCTRIVGVLRNYTFGEVQHMAVTDLDTIIQDALTLLRHQFLTEFKIEIAVNLEPGLKSIVCDHNRIAQALINLLINARDAMQPNGGTIQIKAGLMPLSEETRWHEPSASSNGQTAVEKYALSVCDTGHGVEPAILDKIFDPFFTTKPLGKGTGLGLFLARQIVLQHHGRIWARNNPTGGATFTIALPRKQ